MRFSYALPQGFSVLLDVINFTDEEYATITGFEGPIQQVPRTVLAGIRWAHGIR